MKNTVFAIGLALVSLAVQAGVYSIDNFDKGNQSISFNSVLEKDKTYFDSNFYRTLSATLLRASDPVSSTADVSFGFLNVTNGAGENSRVDVSWTLPALSLVAPAGSSNYSFLFNIVASDGNPTSLALTLDGISLGQFVIPANTQDQIVAFFVDGASLTAGGLLNLELTGMPGWDLQLDAIGLNFTDPVAHIPEPASLALVGLGLAALAGRRRKTR